MQSFLTKGKCCIPAESLWLPTHPLDPGYLQAKHKTKDICSKPTSGHCDSTEEKNTTGIHSKNFPPLGLGFKTSTGQRGQNTLRADACKRFQGKLVMRVLTKIKWNPMFTKGKKGSFPRRQCCKHPLQISQDLSEASLDSCASEFSWDSCASVCSEEKGKANVEQGCPALLQGRTTPAPGLSTGSEGQWKGNSPSFPPAPSASGSCGQGRTSSWAFTALLLLSHLPPGKDLVG